MKASICTKYGQPDVLEIEEIEKPVPKGNEILVKVRSSGVTAADGMMRQGIPFYGRLFIGLMKPKHPVTGTGFAGIVEAAGKDIKRFKTGDKVFGETGLGFGANAEYVCVAEDGVLAKKPDKLSFDEAAPVTDGALTSMNFLKNIAGIKKGQKLLIIGASGGLGTSAVQLAKLFGAEVTGVCSSANTELVKSLGADRVIDYTKEYFAGTQETWDIIYDTVGKSSFSLSKDSLTEDGVFVSPVLKVGLLFRMIMTSRSNGRKAKFSATGLLPPTEQMVLLEELLKLFEEGKLKTVIDRKYSLEQIAEAHRYVQTGHKKGNIVINMEI